ncbi:TRAP transporter small permease [Gemmobacter sp.]|uniref:TRAP transporter small permease subunit n=1 Tax=Gemmobacter sp. TaxID=1898957 RepID=UPI002B00347A|nr:TRAP transporter small permease [Gemmobacter sp.]
MNRFTEIVGRGLVGLAELSVVAMLILVVADVVSRAVFNISIPGIDTIVASYLMVAVSFLPLALLHLLEENIAVDFLRNMVPDAMKDIFDIIAHLLAVAYYGLGAWIFYLVAVEAFHIREYVTGTWDVPIWPARILMPLGLLVGGLAALAMLFRALRALFTGAKPSAHDSTGAF